MNIITPGIKQLVEDNAMALATTNADGSPHVIAVAYCKVFGDEIIITNAHINKSVENIKRNSNIAISVWHSDFESVCVGFELSGTAENVTEGKWYEFVKDMPENKGYDIKSAIVVTVTEARKLES